MATERIQRKYQLWTCNCLHPISHYVLNVKLEIYCENQCCETCFNTKRQATIHGPNSDLCGDFKNIRNKTYSVRMCINSIELNLTYVAEFAFVHHAAVYTLMR